MAPHHRQSDEIGSRARRARDTARVRVRRTTALIGVAATTAAVGLGVLAASDTTAHSADATTGRATPTSASAPSTTPTTAVKSAATTPTTAVERGHHGDDGRHGHGRHGHGEHGHGEHGDDGDDHGPDDLVGRSGDHDVGPIMTPALTGTGTDLDHDAPIALRSMRAIGTTAAVAVTDADCADDALALLAEDLRALDDTCSRFRPDSELRWLEEVSEGRAVVVSPLLFDVVEVACVVAVQTAGIVDPTVGSALIELGYDRDFEDLAGDGMASGFTPTPAPGWWQVRLDRDDHTLAIPTGVHLDVGATAKALAADRSAGRLASSLGCGALVNLGGDVAVAGTTPTGGWAVGIAPRCTTPLDSVDQVVTVHAGGLATSGTTARTWVRDGRVVHHIIDPWTGEPARPVWSLVSTTAPSCVEANAWSTAAVVWGDDAVGVLTDAGVPARLVDTTGGITYVGGWPPDTICHHGRPVDAELRTAQ